MKKRKVSLEEIKDILSEVLRLLQPTLIGGENLVDDLTHSLLCVLCANNPPEGYKKAKLRKAFYVYKGMSVCRYHYHGMFFELEVMKRNNL